jgi:hypothetical protein
MNEFFYLLLLYYLSERMNTTSAIPTNIIPTNISPQAIATNFPKYIIFILPLFIVIYYLYVPDKRSSYLIGVLITFLFTMVMLFCNCEKKKQATSVLLLTLLAYAFISNALSSSSPKKSKFRYFLSNFIIQLSIFLNLFIFVLR